ncbi:acetyl-CoA carboxylase biotin carboxyl carrier protein subunit [bacterium]|nr:acetyl-CoA carboxylase biotin carboxyl carrier protein subunit [bacterium]
MKYKVSNDSKVYDIEIIEHDDRLKVRIGKEIVQELDVDFKTVGKGSVHSMLVGNDSFRVIIDKKMGTHRVYTRGHRFEYTVEDERTFLLRSLIGQTKVKAGGEVKAPIPGLVTKIFLNEGDTVSHGQGVMILEAMKMENEIKAPVNGIITKLAVKPGHNVEKGQNLFVIDT